MHAHLLYMYNRSAKEQLPILKTVGCLSVQYGYPFWQPLTHPAAIFTISITVIFPRKTRLKRRIEENIHTEWIYFRRFEIKIFFQLTINKMSYFICHFFSVIIQCWLFCNQFIFKMLIFFFFFSSVLPSALRWIVEITHEINNKCQKISLSGQLQFGHLRILQDWKSF